MRRSAPLVAPLREGKVAVYLTPDRWPAGSCRRRLRSRRRRSVGWHLCAGCANHSTTGVRGCVILCCGGCSGRGGWLGILPASTCQMPGACPLAPIVTDKDVCCQMCARGKWSPGFQAASAPCPGQPHAHRVASLRTALTPPLRPRAAQRQNLPRKRKAPGGRPLALRDEKAVAWKRASEQRTQREQENR